MMITQPNRSKTKNVGCNEQEVAQVRVMLQLEFVVQ